MTPNDKLPEEILKQIDNESNQRLARQKELAESECDLAYAQGEAEGYATGATEWARWKVKHDELQAQAQRMADALEEIAKEANNSPEDTWGEIAVRMKRIAIIQLQQFKESKNLHSGNKHQWQDDWDIDEQGELNEETK